MSALKKVAIVAAVTLACSSSAALADSGRYMLKRSAGPRNDQYVMVRTGFDRPTQPYALTGDAREVRKATVWPARVHPKGPHDEY